MDRPAEDADGRPYDGRCVAALAFEDGAARGVRIGETVRQIVDLKEGEFETEPGDCQEQQERQGEDYADVGRDPACEPEPACELFRPLAIRPQAARLERMC